MSSDDYGEALSQLREAAGLLHVMFVISLFGFLLNPRGIMKMWWDVGGEVSGAVRKHLSRR